MPTCKKCQNKFPNRIKIEGKIKNISNRKYCIECSPFGQHNTKQIHAKPHNLNEKHCPRCKTVKKIDLFYNRRGLKGGSVYCKSCTNNQVVERQQLFKLKCVSYKGSICSCCGYDKYLGALEFHHLNPDTKDLTISYMKQTSFNDKIKKELDKCVLLCANCHREEHARIKGLL